mmetsp:Transcript_25445/g.73469  ORF Transcript_25445/g.73469 Transcript_25445/m.73469 type:complete len:223 (+) Transcript_25445:931-1599(+)
MSDARRRACRAPPARPLAPGRSPGRPPPPPRTTSARRGWRQRSVLEGSPRLSSKSRSRTSSLWPRAKRQRRPSARGPAPRPSPRTDPRGCPPSEPGGWRRHSPAGTSSCGPVGWAATPRGLRRDRRCPTPARSSNAGPAASPACGRPCFRVPRCRCRASWPTGLPSARCPASSARDRLDAGAPSQDTSRWSMDRKPSRRNSRTSSRCRRRMGHKLALRRRTP